MPVTKVVFQRGCAWCDKALEPGQDHISVAVGGNGIVMVTFHAHVACFQSSLAPMARASWQPAHK